MKKVHIYDNSCCRKILIEEIATSIREKLNNSVEVNVFDLSKRNTSVPIPRSLFSKIQIDGSKCLPAIVVDNSIVAIGKLPELEDLLEMLGSGKPIANPSDCTCSNSCC